MTRPNPVHHWTTQATEPTSKHPDADTDNTAQSDKPSEPSPPFKVNPNHHSAKDQSRRSVRTFIVRPQGLPSSAIHMCPPFFTATALKVTLAGHIRTG